jgi:magnesium transporter
MDYFVRRYNKPGSAPGELEQHETPAAPLAIQFMRFDPDQVHEDGPIVLDDIAGALQRDGLKWLDLQGEISAAALATLGQASGLHPLALEDVLHRGQRAKVDDYGSNLAVILTLPRWTGRILSVEQVSLFLAPGLIISLHCENPDLFAPVRERIRTSPNGRIRSSGADYVFYALVDLVVDSGFPILEDYAEELGLLEAEIIREPHANDLTDRIHETRRELMFFRRALWSQRDATAALLRPDLELVSKSSRLYLRDCHDHAIQILELAESYRDMAGALFDLQLNAMSRRTNDIMRVLTIIATIFIPLTFIAGIYGMNFDPAAGPWNMPELRMPFGYVGVMGLMAAILLGMLLYFKRKDWL